jgi:hypothetical protein
MMGVAGILGGALLCAIHGATKIHYSKMVMLRTHSVRSLQHNLKKHTQWLLQIDSGLKSLGSIL